MSCETADEFDEIFYRFDTHTLRLRRFMSIIRTYALARKVCLLNVHKFTNAHLNRKSRTAFGHSIAYALARSEIFE